jgi:hypothetical protein
MNRIFIYDDALTQNIREILKLNPIKEQIGETEGKLFKVYRKPILLKTNDISIARGNKRVFGSIMEFNDKDMERILYTLDNYNGYSLSRTGVTRQIDFAYRTIISVYPVIARDIHDLENFTYKYEKPVECYAYLGNPEHENIIFSVKVDKHCKLTQGFYKKGFLELLKREGLLHDNIQSEGKNTKDR